jgi:copper(I)-binding protein
LRGGRIIQDARLIPGCCHVPRLEQCAQPTLSIPDDETFFPMLRGGAAAHSAEWSGAGAAAELVKVREPWAKATVPGQKVGGVYMEFVAREDLRLTGVRTAAAKRPRYTNENGKRPDENARRAVLELPAGKSIRLEPGGYHIMLFDLKRSLVPGQKLKLELSLRGYPRTQASCACRSPGPRPRCRGKCRPRPSLTRIFLQDAELGRFARNSPKCKRYCTWLVLAEDWAGQIGRWVKGAPRLRDTRFLRP